jgi:hypothetical protein
MDRPHMGQGDGAPAVVKLRVRYKPTPDMPAWETLWAEPVEDGSYRLQNCSFVVPLAAGDVVRAEAAGDGELQLTGLVAASPSILTVVGAPPGADLDVQSVIDAWKAGGALWTEHNNGLTVTVWPEGFRLDQIEAVVRPTLDVSLIWLATAFPSIRDAEHMPEVEWELERVFIEPVDDDEDVD